jgi:hypothetical protein
LKRKKDHIPPKFHRLPFSLLQVLHKISTKNPYLLRNNAGGRAMVVMDHPWKFLERITLRVILLTVISQYLLFTCIPSQEIDVIFFPNNGAFTSKISWRCDLLHLSIGLNTQCRWRWNKYLTLLVIRGRI